MRKKNSRSTINTRKSKSSKADTDTSEKLIVLDSTDDTDIIECSIVELRNKPASTNGVSKFKEAVKTLLNESDDSLPKTQPKIKKTPERKRGSTVNDNLRNSLRKSFGLDKDVCETDCLLITPFSSKKNTGTENVMEKIISTLKKSPAVSHLSRSKLRNIEQWLQKNDVETIRTPPFANLSVSPVHSNRKKKRGIEWTKKDNKVYIEEKENRYEESPLDSDVEDVLKAVYGDEWVQKKVVGECRTEPRKKKKEAFVPATEIKKRNTKSQQSVRRNILNTDKKVSNEEVIDLDISVVSGVKLINLDNSSCSESFIKTKKIMSVKKKRKADVEFSSNENLNIGSVKKKKKNVEVESAVEYASEKKDSSFGENLKLNVAAKTPKRTFLASLSVSTPTSRCHPDAQYYKTNFKSQKEKLVKKLFKLYNVEVFGGKLGEDMSFTWNVKLRGTAGYCYNKRITKSTGEIIRLSRIEFSTKIVDRADRLRDTMIHELCHAASWVINGVLDGHGAVWGSWASKAMNRFPELPLIKRCHNYDIVSKYVYRCTQCGYSIKRHSKSINIERKRCGHCYGVLELLLNKKKKGAGEVPQYDTTRTLRTPNKFALFVKENYHSVKSSKTNAKHAEIMKTLSQQYALVKNGVKSGKKIFPD